MPKKILRKHQKKMMMYSLGVNHPVLFVEMRLGKTLVIVRLCKLKKLNSILITAPYSAFKGWRDELRAEGEGLPVELTGTREERLNMLYNNWPITRWYIISKEGHRVIPEIKDLPWDAVFLDESTFIKGPATGSKRIKVSAFYTQNFRDVKMRGILTGTPDPESELDYYTQLEFVDGRILPFKNYWEFRKKYFEPVDFQWEITKAGKKYLSQRLAKYCFFMTRKEANLGRMKIYQQRLITMPSEVKKTYNTLKHEFILESPDTFEMTKFATVKFIWLRKLLNGILHGKRYWSGKFDALWELSQGELKNEQLVIWCAYREDIWGIVCELGNRIPVGIIHGGVKKKEREITLEKFHKGEYRWLIAIAECFKHGVDLSCSKTAIYFSTPLGAETRLQSEDRIITLEDDEPVLIIDLIVEHTIEEIIHNSLARKEGRQVMMRRIVNTLRKEKK